MWTICVLGFCLALFAQEDSRTAHNDLLRLLMQLEKVQDVDYPPFQATDEQYFELADRILKLSYAHPQNASKRLAITIQLIEAAAIKRREEARKRL